MLLNTQSLSLAATGDIDVNNAITKTSGSGTTLTLDAGGAMNIDAPISGSSSHPLSLALTSVGTMNLGSAVTTFGGSVSMTTTSGGITLGGNVNAGAGAVTLTGHAGVTQPAGVISASSLTASGAPDSVSLPRANDVAVARLNTGTGNVTFNNVASSYVLGGGGAGALTVTGSGSVTVDQALNFGSINITSNNGITLAADVTTPGAVSLTSVDHLINQTAGRISAIQTTVAAGAGDISLPSATNSTLLVDLSGGHITMVNAGQLIVNSLVSGANKNVYIEAEGALQLPVAPFPIDTGTGQLTLKSGGSLSTTGDLSGSDVYLHGAGGVNIGHNVTANGTLLVTAVSGYGGIVQSGGAITTTGAATFNAGTLDITLPQSGNSFNSFYAT